MAQVNYRTMLNNRPGSAVQRKAADHLAARALSSVPAGKAVSRGPVAGDPPVQCKLRVIETNSEYSDVSVAKAAGKEAAAESDGYDWAALTAPITGSALFTVKDLTDLVSLAGGGEADVLRPWRHVIGEVHTASRFERIKGEWPGVPAVEEGVHNLLETGLVMQPTSTSAQNFAEVFQSKTKKELPLENHHAASLARLMSYLVVWNRYQADPNDPEATTNIVDRAGNLVNIWHAYSSVASAVYMAGMDASYLGIWPSYANAIEKAWGATSFVMTGENSKASIACLERIASSKGLPKISTEDVASVRAWIVEMVEAVAEILKVSAAARADARQIGKHTDATRDLAKNQPGLTKMGDALQSVKPAREIFMAEHIASAPLPSLVKTGWAHLAGLRGHNIANAKFHDNAGAFDGALRAKASDL